MPAQDVGDHALEVGVVGTFAAVAVAPADVYLGLVPEQDRLLCIGADRLERLPHGEAQRLTERGEEALEVVGQVRARPRRERALAEARGGIGDDQLRVDLHLRAEPGAGRAGAEGRVEREGSRFQVVRRHRVLVGAGQLLGEPALPLRVRGRQVDEVERHQSAGQLQRGLDRVGQPAAGVVADREPVDHDVDRVLLLLGEGGHVVQVVGDPVDPHPRVALADQLPEQVDELALALGHQRREHLEAGPGLHLEDVVDDLLRRLPGDPLTADRAVRNAGPRVEQSQVVVDLGDRAHGGARVAGGRLLVDRDRGRQALDEVDVGLVHLAEELAGVGGQRLDVAALALGEDRVEGETGLPRARQTREHDERISRNLDRDVLEIVFSGAPDDQAIAAAGYRR